MRLLRGNRKQGYDQAERLRGLVSSAAEAPGPPPKRVAVVGVKGGVGVTTLVWRLAQALGGADDGSLLAVDANLWQPDLARVGGLAPTDGGDLLAVLAGESAPGDAVRVGDGPSILPGSWAATPAADQLANAADAILDRLAPLGGRFGLQVFDAGVARNPVAMELCRRVDLVIAVATPDELAMLSAYAFVKAIAAAESPPELKLLVNRCANEPHARATHARVRDTCRRFLDRSLASVGWLPHDPRIADRGAEPIPLLRPIARRVREALGVAAPSTAAA